MPQHLLFEGVDLEVLLAEVRATHGQQARIVKAERVRTGGVGGFFAKEKYELTVALDGASPAAADDMARPEWAAAHPASAVAATPRGGTGSVVDAGASPGGAGTGTPEPTYSNEISALLARMDAADRSAVPTRSAVAPAAPAPAAPAPPAPTPPAPTPPAPTPPAPAPSPPVPVVTSRPVVPTQRSAFDEILMSVRAQLGGVDPAPQPARTRITPAAEAVGAVWRPPALVAPVGPAASSGEPPVTDVVADIVAQVQARASAAAALPAAVVRVDLDDPADLREQAGSLTGATDGHENEAPPDHDSSAPDAPAVPDPAPYQPAPDDLAASGTAHDDPAGDDLAAHDPAPDHPAPDHPAASSTAHDDPAPGELTFDTPRAVDAFADDHPLDAWAGDHPDHLTADPVPTSHPVTVPMTMTMTTPPPPHPRPPVATPDAPRSATPLLDEILGRMSGDGFSRPAIGPVDVTTLASALSLSGLSPTEAAGLAQRAAAAGPLAHEAVAVLAARHLCSGLQLPTAPGAVVVVAGLGPGLARQAHAVAELMTVDEASLTVFGDPVPGLAAAPVLTTADITGAVARAEAALSPLVVVVATPETVAGARRTARIVAAVGAVAVVGVWDSGRDAYDAQRWVATMTSAAAAPALALTGCADTGAVASVATAGCDVVLLDGRAATVGAWAALIVDRLDQILGVTVPGAGRP